MRKRRRRLQERISQGGDRALVRNEGEFPGAHKAEAGSKG